MSVVVELVAALVGSALDALDALTAGRHRRGIRRAASGTAHRDAFAA